MKLYMIRRTRTFIKDNYAKLDTARNRKYLTFSDGSKSYFPDRIPKKAPFKIDESNADDQYAMLYSSKVVDAINGLNLPRYGLGNYVEPHPENPPTSAEDKIIKDLSQAGKRLMGFCRTNFFKRLESSGFAFLLSICRHIVRNHIYIHALENDLPLPIGKQASDLVETDFYNIDDRDIEDLNTEFFNDEVTDKNEPELKIAMDVLDFEKKAKQIYKQYETLHKSKFRWLKSNLFIKKLIDHFDEKIVIHF